MNWNVIANDIDVYIKFHKLLGSELDIEDIRES